MTAAGRSGRRFEVDEAGAGERLDLFLTARCPDLTRSQIQAALAAGGVAVGGRQRPKGHRLRAGDVVELTPPALPPAAAAPQDLPLAVVHEDEHLLVVDKPAGLVVHPAPGHPDGTLVNAVLYRRRVAAGEPARPGIVHRLDRDTSGLLVVALTELAFRSLAAQIRARTVARTYLALSWGAWPAAAGILSGDLGRHPRHRQKVAVLPAGGRRAVTRYEVAEDFGFVQLCRARLETGRTHQIRVHFAHYGHPIVGDRVYGEDRRAHGVHPLDRARAVRLVALARRQLLHAAELALDHPATGERLTFRSPPPADLAAALAWLRGENPR